MSSRKYTRSSFAVVEIQFAQNIITPVIADSQNDDTSSPNMYNVQTMNAPRM
jgi:hypothetical protein